MLRTAPSSPSPGTPLLGHLMFSAPPKSRAASAGASALSLLCHALLLTVAVLLITGRKPQAAVAPPGFDIVLPTEAPPPPLPPPPAPRVPEAMATSAAPGPVGFPRLTAPTITLDHIPPIQMGPITDESVWTAVGPSEGDPRSTRPASDSGSAGVDVNDPHSFVPYTLAPALKNVEAVRRALVRAYPAMLRDAGMAGKVLVWVLVDEQGQVMNALVKQGSGMPALDDAALGVARMMQFTPGMNRDIAVKVWVAVPVDFRVER